MTLKQLGIYKGPIIILNTLNFYDSLIDFLEHMIARVIFSDMNIKECGKLHQRWKM